MELSFKLPTPLRHHTKTSRSWGNKVFEFLRGGRLRRVSEYALCSKPPFVPCKGVSILLLEVESKARGILDDATAFSQHL